MTSIQKQPLFTNVRFHDGAFGRVFFNDLPFFQGYKRDGFSQNSCINHLLVPGENTMLIELLRAPEPRGGRLEFQPDPNPNLGGMDLNQSLDIHIFRERSPGTKDIEVLSQTMFPDCWKDIEEKDRCIPYQHTVHFDLQVSVPELAFLSATPEKVPCEGTSELHEALRELHQALVDKDRNRTLQAMELQMEEYERAHGGEGGSSMRDQYDAIDELFAEHIVVAPLEPHMLHFTTRANDRVVHIERIDAQPVLDIKTIGKPQGHASDPVFTRHNGRWCLM